MKSTMSKEDILRNKRMALISDFSKKVIGWNAKPANDNGAQVYTDLDLDDWLYKHSEILAFSNQLMMLFYCDKHRGEIETMNIADFYKSIDGVCIRCSMAGVEGMP